MTKHIKSFPTSEEMTEYLDGATNGYYLLKDESDTGNTRIHFFLVNTPNFFCVKALSNSTVTFNNKVGDIKFSVDGGTTWTTNEGQTTTLSANTKMYWKRMVNTPFNGSVGQFSVTGNVALQGNINSLISSTFENLTDLSYYDNVFNELFIEQTAVTDVSKLTLPSTILCDGCYYAMFKNCSNLKGVAPVLPALNVGNDTYSYMFKDTDINRVYCKATSIGTQFDWLEDVHLTGDFYNIGGASLSNVDIPNGWIIHSRIDE